MTFMKFIFAAIVALAPVAGSATTTYISSPVASYSLTGASGSGSIISTYDASTAPTADPGDRYGYYYAIVADGASNYDLTVTGQMTDLLGVNIGASFGAAPAYSGASNAFNQPLFALGDYGTTALANGFSPAMSLIVPAGETYYITVEFEQFKEGWIDFQFSWNQTSAAAVPLPAALPLLVAALGGMGIVARRKRRAES